MMVLTAKKIFFFFLPFTDSSIKNLTFCHKKIFSIGPVCGPQIASRRNRRGGPHVGFTDEMSVRLKKNFPAFLNKLYAI
jgi:hypothetical protein